MGASSSRIEDDKALLLCRERRHYVRQALDGRCSLAAAHVSYIQALRNTGMALGKFVEPEVPAESSLYTSTSASGTPEPLALTDKSASLFSNSSPSLSQNVETAEPFSPIPSPPSSDRFHVNYMKSGQNYSTTVEERPPISVTATLRPSSDATLKLSSHNAETSNFDAQPHIPGTPPWDYFGIFHPIDNQFPFQDGRPQNHVLDNFDDIRLREEEGIPDLEDEGEKFSVNGKSESLESDDEFDQPPTESLVRIFKNRNEVQDSQANNGSVDVLSANNMDLETKQGGEKTIPRTGISGTNVTPNLTPTKSAQQLDPLPVHGKGEAEKESGAENKHVVKDFLSSVKEIEELFIKASESGKEVPRMLEANKVNFRPLLPEAKAHRSKGSPFFTSFLACCKEESYNQEEPVSNEVKYLTWHRSVSSLSSSSHNPLGATSRDDVGDVNIFSGICMNSGSHASTLDRLYAWERKLYDEVKASGLVRKEYDMKCKLLRLQDSKGESAYKVDRTRAKVKDLHSRVRVAIQRIDSISKTIEDLRDKELQPQLEELIGGLLRMWTMMLECHKRQHSIIAMAYNNGGPKISIQSESNRHAAIVLEYELNSLCSSFTKWISAHKSYLEAINQWLLKCVLSVRQKSTRRRSIQQSSPWVGIPPPVYIACQDWLAGLDELQTKEVAEAIKDLVAETAHFMPRQEKNHRRSKSSFSIAQKIDRSDGLTEDMLRNEATVTWSLGLDSLQSRLEVFLDKLKTFSERSVKMYEDLRDKINVAQNRYENAQKRV